MTTAVLHRLLRSTHRAVFDQSPESDLAFRLRDVGGLTWEVLDGSLTVRTTSPVTVRSYNLLDRTLGELADELEADGYEVISQNSELSHLGARVLVPGNGDQNVSNGDHLYAYKSLLWVLLNGYSMEIGHAEYQVGQALRQMVLTQAEGEWLDLWANLYGVPRLDGESDAALQARIPDEVFRLRVNGIAIEKAVKASTGKDVEIREPWKRMFRLNRSKLSGLDHLHDGDYYTYHVIQPVARTPYSWADVLASIERNRAAGVVVYTPALELPVFHVNAEPPCEFTTQLAGHQLRVMRAWRGGCAPLGLMRLDNNDIHLNHLMMSYQLRTYANAEGAQSVQDLGDRRNVAYAAVVLSGGVPLGDQNAILSRGQRRTVFTPDPALSDTLSLSGYDVDRQVRRVERVSTDAHGILVDLALSGPFTNARLDERTYSAGLHDNEANAWSGSWGPRPWYPSWRIVGSAMTSTTA